MLEELYAGALADSSKRAEIISANALEEKISHLNAPLNALQHLAKAEHIKVIAEVKRASPSKGHLADIPEPASLAGIYEKSGASAISVLTEERRFKGSLADLSAVRAQVTIPVLRKDFIRTEYQILEARAAGADFFLLIVAGLKEVELSRLKHFGEQLGMKSLVETHNADEVRIAVNIGSEIIGVNARDLSTFETDRNLFGRIVDLIPSEAIKVAESAVRDAKDVAHYRSAGADVVLVGEALVTNDPAATLRSFLAI